MKRFAISFVVSNALVGFAAGPSLAYRCPALVEECQTTADIVAARPGSDRAAVDKARKGCDEAMKLHWDARHKESMIKAGEAIAALSKALQ